MISISYSFYSWGIIPPVALCVVNLTQQLSCKQGRMYPRFSSDEIPRLMSLQKNLLMDFCKKEIAVNICHMLLDTIALDSITIKQVSQTSGFGAFSRFWQFIYKDAPLVPIQHTACRHCHSPIGSVRERFELIFNESDRYYSLLPLYL